MRNRDLTCCPVCDQSVRILPSGKVAAHYHADTRCIGSGRKLFPSDLQLVLAEHAAENRRKSG